MHLEKRAKMETPEERNEVRLELSSEEEDPYERCNQTETSCTMSNGRDIFPSIWLRCCVQDDFRLDRFLLDYHIYFLPYIGFVLWGVYLLKSAF